MQVEADFERYRRILIVATNHVGNNLFCTPAARFLKRNFPAVDFDVLCTSRRGADTFRGNPDIAHVRLAFTRRRARNIAAEYDFVIVMYTGSAARCVRGLSGPHATIEPDFSLHRADQRLEFVRSLTGRPILPEDRRYTIGWSESDLTFVKKRFAASNGSGRRIGLHLGCGRTGVHGWKFWYSGRDRDPRLWSLENYIELALRLKRLEPQLQFVITGSPNERFLARKFQAAVPDTISLVGKTSIRTVAALMSQLQLFITQDTGILHVASATNVPIVGLFGPSDVHETGPYPMKPHHTIIKKTAMADISPAQVAEAAIESLAKLR